MVRALAAAKCPPSASAPLLTRCLPSQSHASWSWISSPSRFGVPAHVSRPDSNSSLRQRQQPMLSVWMVAGPIKLASAMVKAHSSALLIVLRTSNSASIVPWFAYHGSSSWSWSSCTTAPLHAACLPDTPFNEPSTAMCLWKPSILLSLH